jgi:hypothetical protein
VMWVEGFFFTSPFKKGSILTLFQDFKVPITWRYFQKVSKIDLSLCVKSLSNCLHDSLAKPLGNFGGIIHFSKYNIPKYLIWKTYQILAP